MRRRRDQYALREAATRHSIVTDSREFEQRSRLERSEMVVSLEGLTVYRKFELTSDEKPKDCDQRDHADSREADPSDCLWLTTFDPTISGELAAVVSRASDSRTSSGGKKIRLISSVTPHMRGMDSLRA